MNNWQPISTIPTNGEKVLVTDGKNMQVVNMPIGYALGIWNKYRGKWYGNFIQIKATAWRPLPKLPTSFKPS